MNIHEYQAKELFATYGVPVSPGVAVQTEDAFDDALNQFPEDGMIVVKSQIHAGGRGKGTFTDGYQGGVKLTRSRAEAKEVASKMLGNTLVTHQTGPAGRKVQTIFFTGAESIAHEYYLAILMDRETSKPVIIASTEGGVDIEEVAENRPEKITKVFVDPTLGIQPFQMRQVAFGLGFTGQAFKDMVKTLNGLYQFFWEKDASMVEVNPLILTEEGGVIALDAKVGFDDNALFRHPDIVALRDLNEEDDKEIEASKFSLSYIALDGNIACLVNGAGLAMATMDIIKHFGGDPANFLDVGGGATAEQVTAAFKIILSDPNVKGILVNIFGGIMKCDIIAQGIIEAAKNVDITVPLVVRLEGTNVELGKKLLDESGLDLTAADSLTDAAEKIVNLVKEA
ncbi:MAG: ADP-forming succinate--CoA ligase subunit beta [Verrucomicrobia bacterium]|nr:ADP-forming succinate--CoA ligase subunit beta [Verrucomicrobiota bacterium]MDA1065651.1 ADP-forming succinate--CoA ligase subunit beta [Verrucomicrobiota bacterium]